MNFTDLKTALARTKQFAEDAIEETAVYMKMGRDTFWTLGTAELAVEEDSQWAVNPASFSTGYSAFNASSQRVGEEMRSLSEEPIALNDLPVVDGKWGAQIGFSVKCMNGDDEGMEALIYQRSKGGREAATALLDEILQRVNAGHEDCVPLIELSHDSYKHKTYGKIYVPLFLIRSWVTMDGDTPPEETQAALAPPEEATKPKRRARRRAA